MKYDFHNDKTLKKIEQIIVNTVHPDKIILFGSRARGEVTGQSDYDILIIKKHLKNERDLTRKINYRIYKENIAAGVDVIATSAKKWKENSDNIAYIYKTIKSEGIVLHES